MPSQGGTVNTNDLARLKMSQHYCAYQHRFFGVAPVDSIPAPGEVLTEVVPSTNGQKE